MLDIKLEKQLPTITMNFAEVKKSLVEGSLKYKGLVVTEEGLKDCKAMQGELSSTRIKLDTYRKEVKKEMTKPITKFEDQCKELIALVSEVEIPLKAGIDVFNQKVRDENRVIAENIIKSFIKEEGLNEKYSKDLIVIDKYCNLTSKVNEVTDDVAKRGYLLLQQQETEIETLQIMNDTIVNLNKNIDAKLSIEDFQSLIDTNTSPVKIMAEINARAERIKASELKAVEDRKAKAEKEVLERIAKAEREAAEKARIEERNIRIAKEAAEDTERLKKEAELKSKEVIVKETIKKTFEKFDDEVKEEIAKEKPIIDCVQMGKQYFIEMRVEGTIEEITALSQFLKSNKYDYNATKKGLV